MVDNERTENLLETTNKKKKLSTSTIILISLVALVLVIFLVTLFFFYKTSKDNRTAQQTAVASGANAGLTYTNPSNPGNLTEDVLQDKVETALADNNYAAAEEGYIQLFNLTQDSSYLDKAESVISGNTTGNLGNIGKLLKVGDTYYISTTNGSNNSVWRVQGESAEVIYTVSSQVYGINDLQYWDNKIYMKSAGEYGYLDLSNNQFTPVELTDPGIIPISPRVYNQSLYYLATDGRKGASLYKANLDGTNNEQIVKIGKTITTDQVIAFTIIYGKAYVFFNFRDTKDGSEIYAFSLSSGQEEEVYTTSNYIQQYITYANGGLYFMENPNTNKNANNTVKRINLGSHNIKTILTGDNSGISTINTSGDKLFYISANQIFSANLEGEGATLIGQPTDEAKTLGNTMYRRLLFTGGNNLFSQFRGLQNDVFKTITFEETDSGENFHQLNLAN